MNTDDLLGSIFGDLSRAAAALQPEPAKELEQLQLDALLYLIKALEAVRVLVEATRRQAAPAAIPAPPGSVTIRCEDHDS